MPQLNSNTYSLNPFDSNRDPFDIAEGALVRV
jgi:hypothetical protein